MPGIFNYLSDRHAPLVIQGNLFSNYFKMEDFMVENQKSSESNNNPIIPDDVEFKLNAAILKFTFAGFEAQNITGEIEIKKQKAIINDMTLETMEGDATIDAFADNSQGKLNVVLESNLKNINITKLFTGFNNFGQTTLQNKNLKGYASATVNFSGNWSNQLEADYKSIVSNADVSIEKGELIDFQPLLSLGKYLDVNDLKHIKFSSLNSSIQIADSKIIIPRTSIKNSALDIDLRGSHTFDNYIDYHIRLLNEDLKAKRKKGKNNEFGPVVTELDKKRTIFIKMVGNIDNPKIDYDVKDMKEKIKEDWKEEKQNVRQILKEEMGLFKKDSTKKTTKKPDQVFELEKPTNQPKKSSDTKNKEEDDGDF
jgi:hypothetical protein